MKKIMFLPIMAIFTTNAQITNRLIVTQNTDSGINPPNIMYTVPPNDNRIYQTSTSNLKITTSQITGLSLEIQAIGDSRYKLLNYTPSNSEVISALGFNPIPSTRELTINGVTFNLNSDRNWNVGDIYSSGIYSNPSWLTSLDYAKITNKPFIPTLTSNLTNDSGYISNVPAQSFNSLTGKPTTLSGYGITDAYPLTGNPSGFLTNITSTQINTALGFTPYNGSTNPNGYITSTSLTTKQDNLVSGTNIKTIETQSLLGSGNIDLTKADVGLSNVDNTSDANKNISVATQTALDLKYNASNPSNYINQAGARTAINLTTTGTGAATYNNVTGTLNIPTPNTAKRQLTYSGVTDATGNYTVVFATPFTVAPNIQQNLIGGSALQGTLITSITTTGFTIQAYTRSTVSSLPIIGTLTGLLVGAATNPLVGGSVDVIITEK